MVAVAGALAASVFATAISFAGGAATSYPAGTAYPVSLSGAGSPRLAWRLVPTGTTVHLRALAAVSASVAWVGGTGGTVLRTTDGGVTWTRVRPPGSIGLDVGDVEATSADHAVVLTSGEGSDSRIYVTDDGGRSWAVSFLNGEPTAFYDCLTFSSATRGYAVSDPVGGTFRILETLDGGRSWSPLDTSRMPPSRPNEFGVAASGSCLSAGADGSVHFVSGGDEGGRVFTSRDRGRTWSVTDTRVTGGAAAGLFSVAFRGSRTGIAVGGDLSNPTGARVNAVWSGDGGTTWIAPSPGPAGYRTSVAWVPYLPSVALAVGPGGSDATTDSGRSWHPFDRGSFDAVSCTADRACWAAGEQGQVAVLAVTRR